MQMLTMYVNNVYGSFIAIRTRYSTHSLGTLNGTVKRRNFVKV